MVFMCKQKCVLSLDITGSCTVFNYLNFICYWQLCILLLTKIQHFAVMYEIILFGHNPPNH